MARPKVFISSTFFDLRQVRADLERFIRDIGYEPVQHERGQVPYGSAERLEKYCYKEIGQVDLVVNVVGGRFGSVSYDDAYSISQMELRTAVKLNKQCYVFVESSVLAEYRMYLRNKSVEGINYVAADDTRILAFIEEVEGLPRNNQLIEFRQVDEIVGHLREQWAGLFQRFLQEQEQLPVRRAADELRTALKTVNQLITFLTEERRQQGSTISDILLTNHPLFAQLRSMLKSPYPLFLPTRTDLANWLEARSYKQLAREQWEDPATAVWANVPRAGKTSVLQIAESIFDGEKLRVFTSGEWNKNWIKQRLVDPVPVVDDFEDFPGALEDDDDLPF